MYENIVNSLRYCAENDCSPKCPRAGIGKGCIAGLKREAAVAIVELQTTLCNWCAVCPRDKRDLSTCEIYESCRAKPPKGEK